MQVSAAVLRRVNDPLRVERLELAEPGPRDVLVRMGAAGLCHTDLEVMRGAISMPLPMVLGHEGQGSSSRSAQPSTASLPVIMSSARGTRPAGPVSTAVAASRCCARPALGRPARARCPTAARPLRDADGPVRQFMFVGSHADHAVITEAAAVKVPVDLPFGIGAAIGCGITTGLVPALHSPAASVPGSLIAVVGCGIVGLSVIIGGRLAGASKIVAIERSAARLELAGRLGADVVVDSSREDPLATIRGPQLGSRRRPCLRGGRQPCSHARGLRAGAARGRVHDAGQDHAG